MSEKRTLGAKISENGQKCHEVSSEAKRAMLVQLDAGVLARLAGDFNTSHDAVVRIRDRFVKEGTVYGIE
ncbi:hypothetical protein B0J15DRAFT_506735 [Fusarium solani]|jgi:hypothetical protein|uniref:Uncharacterized protein n=1 Tax=Fusarium solani TaxID=169388 RepID=A0A9P9G0E3_FUSSL|nr:uncharacterized protein B0J15DRAFT_506735 [Fusarium solani]KAH7222690.1 hypothetical protein B0J15DRAFT_506735 [Fusarium solani]